MTSVSISVHESQQHIVQQLIIPKTGLQSTRIIQQQHKKSTSNAIPSPMNSQFETPPDLKYLVVDRGAVRFILLNRN